MPARRAALFITCLGDLVTPEVGLATVRLLERCGVAVDFPAGQTCCGQAHCNSGYRREAVDMARHFLRAFAGAEAIVAPSGSCVAMVRHTYPELLAGDQVATAQARDLAGRTHELSEFLVEVLGIEDLGAAVSARAAYHPGCHMTRGLGVVDPPRRLLAHVRGLDLVDLERPDLCCGFGGLFAVKEPEVSVAMADDKLAAIRNAGVDLVVGADAGCLLHLQGRMDRLGMAVRTVHLATLLAEGVAG